MHLCNTLINSETAHFNKKGKTAFDKYNKKTYLNKPSFFGSNLGV